MMNKSYLCQNSDRIEIIAIKSLNFDAEIRAFFEAFRGQKADRAKKRADWGIRPKYSDRVYNRINLKQFAIIKHTQVFI